MKSGPGRLLRATVLLLAAAGAAGAPGTLKVAACEAYWPYVGVGEGSQLTGFDVQFWELLYPEMKSLALQKSDTEVLAMLGDSAPPIAVVPRAKLMADLQAGSIDVGLCGLQITSEHQKMFDQTPGVISSGFRAIIKYEKPELDGMSVLKGAFVGLNASAVFSLLLLLILSIINAHVIFVLERHDNVHVSKVYGWGVFDAWWLSLVTALTVGYGDKVPVTFGGKLAMLVWMFIGTYCMGMFSAAVTSDFLAPTDGDIRHGLATIRKFSDLKPTSKVGTAELAAREFISSTVDGIAVTQFTDTRTLLRALRDGMIDVAVDDQWHTRWLIENDVEFKGLNLLPVGEVVVSKPRAFGVSRRKPEASAASQHDSHPILRVLNPAVVHFAFDAGYARFESISSAWLLNYEPLLTVTYAEALSDALFYWNVVYGLGLLGFIILWAVCVYIHYRKLIADRRVRDGMLLAMGLDHKFTQKELRDAALKFFREVDTDGSETVDANELVDKLQAMGMVLQPEDLDTIFDEGVAAEYTLVQDESVHNMSSMNIFGKERRQTRHMDVKQFQTVVLKLAMGTQSEQNTELTAPVLQVHLEQAMLELKDHLHYIEKRINQINTQKMPTSPTNAANGKISAAMKSQARLGAEHEEKDGARTPSPHMLKSDVSTIRKPHAVDSGLGEYWDRMEAFERTPSGNDSYASRRPNSMAPPPHFDRIERQRYFFTTPSSSRRPDRIATEGWEGHATGNHDGNLSKPHYMRNLGPREGEYGHVDDLQGVDLEGKLIRRDTRPASAVPPGRRESSGNPSYDAQGNDHPFAPSHDYAPRMPAHGHSIPRYQPPPIYKRQRAVSARPGVSERGLVGAGYADRDLVHEESIAARSGTVTVVQNQVMAEHMVEVSQDGHRSAWTPNRRGTQSYSRSKSAARSRDKASMQPTQDFRKTDAAFPQAEEGDGERQGSGADATSTRADEATVGAEHGRQGDVRLDVS